MVDPKQYEKLAELMKTIGHPIRLTILIGLLKRESCVKDIWDCLGLPQATVSQHLAILKNKDILRVKKIGVKREYSLASPMIEKLLKVMLEDEENKNA